MTAKFNRFRNKMQTEGCCDLKLDASFITQGSFATKINHVRLNEIKAAGLIINSSEGPDSAIVYTYKLEQKDNELLKGDYFIWNDKRYFVYENVDIVTETIYKKQWAYECNADITVNGDGIFYGYFVSSLKRAQDDNMAQHIMIVDKEKPMLVIPKQQWTKVGQRMIINGKPWRIIEVDGTTNNNICYCTLNIDWIDKSEDVVEHDFLHSDNAELEANKLITLSTEDGYFAASAPIDIINRTSAEVVIKIPFGINSVDISTKQNKEITTKTYKVVIR